MSHNLSSQDGVVVFILLIVQGDFFKSLTILSPLPFIIQVCRLRTHYYLNGHLSSCDLSVVFLFCWMTLQHHVSKGISQTRSSSWSLSSLLQDGRLRPGDQLIAINKESLIGVTHDEAKSMLNKVKFRWVTHGDSNLSFSIFKQVLCIVFSWRKCNRCVCSYIVFMDLLSSQDSTVEIAFIPGKGLFPSSTSLHNGIQRAAGNNYNSGRLKVHIRSPEVSWFLLFFFFYRKDEKKNWQTGYLLQYM